METFIASKCNQKCVYWPSPANDGEGGFTFDDSIELDCRWEEMTQLTTDSKGNAITSRAVVFLTQDVDEEGMLYLGTLESLYDNYATESSGGGVNDPKTIPGTYFIKRFQKTPNLQGTEFLRKAYLTPSLSFGGF
jgi:hypothetical protein